MNQFYDNLNIWNFNIDNPDPATGFNMRMAFGFYNASDFSPPIGIERIAILRAYMINQQTNAEGGIQIKRIDLKMH